MNSISRIFMVIVILLLIWPVNALSMDKETARKRIAELSSEISRHNYLYYVLGQPEITKTEYDRLFNELIDLEKRFPDLVLPDSPSQRVGSELQNDFPVVTCFEIFDLGVYLFRVIDIIVAQP